MDKKNKKKQSCLDFEIEFYEKLIEDKPDFIEALIPLAENYTKVGEYEKGLSVDQRLALLRPDDPIIHYNLACSNSLLKRIEESFVSLKRAIELGYNDFRHIETDKDLIDLRKDYRYQELMAGLSRKKRS